MYFCRQNLFLFKMVNFRFVARWMFNLSLWGVITSMAWICFSCDEFCEEPNRTAVVINFFSADDALLKVINVEIRGVGDKDSILYDPNAKTLIYGGKDFTQVLLPVNPTADSISFSIKNNALPADTITIRYTRHNGFISPVCGCVTYAEIEGEPESTYHSITNIVVTNPNAATVSYRQGVVNEENIRIYY